MAKTQKGRITNGASPKGKQDSRAGSGSPGEQKGGQKIKAGEVVALRNDFYKDQVKTTRRILLVAIACLLTGLMMAYYGVSHQQRNVYFATNQGGAIIKLIPLSQPNHKDSVVSQWLTRALVNTFDFNFNDMDYHLNVSKERYFTKNGGQQLIKSLSSSDTMNAVKNNKLTVSLAITQVPIVVHEGLYSSGYYAWLLQAPGIITYRNTKNKTYTENVVFTVMVQRRSMLEDPTGLGIAQIIKKDVNQGGS